MMIIFIFSTNLLLGVTVDAKQNAWIVDLLATIVGCVVYLIYIALFLKYPELPLTSYIRKIWGKYIGGAISFFYIIYFIYMASRVLRDFEGLLVMSTYHQTSIITIGICMTFVLIYANYKGIEVLSRVSCICFVLIFISIIIITIMQTVGGYMKFEKLGPVLDEGWRPIWKTLFPVSIMVPFGELIAFTMILPYLNKKNHAKKYGLIAILVGGVYLAINSVILLSILGEDVARRSSFPALTAVSYINLAGFIQRMETLIIIMMVIFGFVKASIFFFCATIGATDVLRVKSSFTSIYLIGIIIFFSSLAIAPTYLNHLDEGLKVLPYWVALPFQIGIPILLLITAVIRDKMKSTAS
jgi:spore germination protein KB